MLQRRESRTVGDATVDSLAGPCSRRGRPSPVGSRRLSAHPWAASSQGERAQVIRSKIQPPPLRSSTLSRQRLLDRLTDATSSRLTLVVAEAGYGKTTLLDGLLRARQRSLPLVQAGSHGRGSDHLDELRDRGSARGRSNVRRRQRCRCSRRLGRAVRPRARSFQACWASCLGLARRPRSWYSTTSTRWTKARTRASSCRGC